jgi:S-adenosylmethionine synthetase
MQVMVRATGVRPSELEIVERKGLGHPDSICDSLAENLSLALCRAYLDRFGEILHHNVDKALLVGGRARPAFGGGEILEPIEIHLAGRATARVGDVAIPIAELAHESTRAWFRKNLRAVDFDRHVRLQSHVRPGSVELRGLFEKSGSSRIRLANDTSCGVGYAPLSPLEELVLELERQLNSPEFLRRNPAGGEDVKVMATRSSNVVSITVSRAFIGAELGSMADYEAAKAVVLERATALARSRFAEVRTRVNAADDVERGGVYLTVTGTSAEAGDDGEVGRGNRLNGLITPNRPMSLEAVAGKNPVTHVGKLYNIVARAAAESIARELAPDVARAEVFLSSRIGDAVNEPAIAEVRLELADPARVGELERSAIELVHAELDRLDSIPTRLLEGTLSVI